MSHESHVLLTGATGLIGSKWLAKLLAADPERQVTVLTRHPENIRTPASSRVSTLRADVAAERLGLADDSHCALERSVTEIIHSAADIRFSLPLSQAREVNTAGTARLIDLARACHRLQKFAHVSTVYVAGKSPGAVPEGPYRNVYGFFNTYQQSKYEAEEVVVNAMGDIPSAIFRLSSVIGDSRTGVVEQFNYFHQILKLVPMNRLPVIPGIPDAPVDLIASNWAVKALSTLFESDFRAGHFYNVCAGPAGSLTVRELVEATFEQVRSHPRCCAVPGIRAPELVSLDEFEKFTREGLNGEAPRFRDLLRTLSQFLPHLGIRQHFENGITLSTLVARGVHLPPIRSYYSNVVQYCLDLGWVNEPASGARRK